MKNELNSLMENELIIIMIILVIVNYHPGGAGQLKYVILLILTPSDKLTFFYSHITYEGSGDDTKQGKD